MKNHLTCFICLLGCVLNYCQAQTSSDYTSKSMSCQSELSTLQGKKAQIDADYALVEDELKRGLFCSKCNHSKSQIEKGGTNFYQHIKDVKGNVVTAPPEAYTQAKQDYDSKVASWQQEVQSKEKSCSNLQQMAQQAAKNEQNRAAQQAQQQRQNMQQQAAQQQQAKQQQEEQAKERLAQAIKEQQDKIKADNAIQQQNFRQSVSDYVSTQSDENKQRQADADQVAQQGAAISQTIQGNSVDLSKINPNNMAGSSVFNTGFSYEDAVKTDQAENNVYLDQYNTTAREVTQDAIISESNLPDVYKKGYEMANNLIDRFNGAKDMLSGKITENTVNGYFSVTSEPGIIQTIQKASGGVAVRSADVITNLSERLGSDDFSEKDVDKAFNDLNPLHISQPAVKAQKPVSYKDVVVVVGGGVLLSAFSVPILVGIAAAGYYGFNR